MRERVTELCVLGATLVLIATTTATAATTQTFTTSQSEFTAGVRNQGWWSADPRVLNSDANANYVASRSSDASQENFFTFDLRDLSTSCTVRSATLRLTRFQGSGTGPLTYRLWDVSTPPAILNDNDGFSPSIAADLSSGTLFGGFVIDSDPSLPPDEVLSFPFNSAGVAAVSAARGDFFSIGGALASPNGFLFGFSGSGGTQELVVECQRVPTSKEECKNGGWRNFPGVQEPGGLRQLRRDRREEPAGRPLARAYPRQGLVRTRVISPRGRYAEVAQNVPVPVTPPGRMKPWTPKNAPYTCSHSLRWTASCAGVNAVKSGPSLSQ